MGEGQSPASWVNFLAQFNIGSMRGGVPISADAPSGDRRSGIGEFVPGVPTARS